MAFMDELDHLSEHQHLEFKKAERTLPASLWETYSAFANASGGQIVLGVDEAKAIDGRREFKVTGVEDPTKLIDDFWNQVRNPQKVTADVMYPDGINPIVVDGRVVVVIDVPRAERGDKPVRVQVKGDKEPVAFLRRGSGDYRCGDADLRRMLFDASNDADGKTLPDLTLEALNGETIRRYRRLFDRSKPRLRWSDASTEDFLYYIRALARDRDGVLRPTQAGLLAFGEEYEIVQRFPRYHLDYRQETSGARRWDDRVDSMSGEWSGNLVDFYLMVAERLDRVLPHVFGLADGGMRHTSRNEVNDAVHEAVANAIVHAYYGDGGVVTAVLTPNGLEISNTGTLLLDRDVAIYGNLSEVRNPILARIFRFVDIVDRAGSGLRAIFDLWRGMFADPVFEERYAPEEVYLELPLVPLNGVQRSRRVTEEEIVRLFGEYEALTVKDLTELLDMKTRTAQNWLKRLKDKGLLGVRTEGRRSIYWLRED